MVAVVVVVVELLVMAVVASQEVEEGDVACDVGM